MTSGEDSALALPDAGRRHALAALLAQEPLARVMEILSGGGEESRLVGGAVRNTLMGLAVTDIDIATTMLPEDTMRRAAAAGFRPVPSGLAHGTVTVVAGGQPFEVTTLREDVATDGRHATVFFGRDFSHDAQRRDFTMNALMLGRDGMLHDTVGGFADLDARHVRFIGDASARIAEDCLRILRFFRFHAAYGKGLPDPAGLAACIAGRDGLDGLSRERVRAELMKLLMAAGAVAGVGCMADTGLWQRVTGGIALPARLAQMLRLLPEASAAERLAAACVMIVSDAERLRAVLRLSNAEHRALVLAARAFEALHGRELPDARAARQWSHRLGHAPFMLAMACLHRHPESSRFLELGEAAQVPVFPLSGRDVVNAGIGAGARVGQVLSQAERLWAKADFPVAATELDAILAEAIRLLPD